MPDSSPIVLVFAGDEGYALPMGAAIYSALVNLSAERAVEIFVLDGGIGAESKQRMKQVVASVDDVHARLHFVQPSSMSFSEYTFRTLEQFNETIYYRLLIPELIPQQFTKAIYLDADVIVEANLDRLWTHEMDGHALLAVPERTVSDPEWGVAQWRELGLDPNAPYFNSGMLVLNLRRWREEAIGHRIMKYLTDQREALNYPGDQEGFNAILCGDWKPLDWKWNVVSSIFDSTDKSEFAQKQNQSEISDARYDDLLNRPYIIHYTGYSIRPWEPGGTHPKRKRFYHYLRQSGWFTHTGYLTWRARLAIQSVLYKLEYVLNYIKNISRPYRHRIGLRRSVFSSQDD